jgi:hypothetical protein
VRSPQESSQDQSFEAPHLPSRDHENRIPSAPHGHGRKMSSAMSRYTREEEIESGNGSDIDSACSPCSDGEYSSSCSDSQCSECACRIISPPPRRRRSPSRPSSAPAVIAAPPAPRASAPLKERAIPRAREVKTRKTVAQALKSVTRSPKEGQERGERRQQARVMGETDLSVLRRERRPRKLPPAPPLRPLPGESPQRVTVVIGRW